MGPVGAPVFKSLPSMDSLLMDGRPNQQGAYVVNMVPGGNFKNSSRETMRMDQLHLRTRFTSKTTSIHEPEATVCYIHAAQKIDEDMTLLSVAVRARILRPTLPARSCPDCTMTLPEAHRSVDGRRTPICPSRSSYCPPNP